jgi:hypothetical protein
MSPVTQNEENKLGEDDETLDLTREADSVRQHLLATVEELDHRRHDALDLRRQVRLHLKTLVATGAVAILAALTGVAALVHRAHTAKQRRRHERAEMLTRLWEHPERVGTQEAKPSLLPSLARTVFLALTSRAVKRAVG